MVSARRSFLVSLLVLSASALGVTKTKPSRAFLGRAPVVRVPLLAALSFLAGGADPSEVQVVSAATVQGNPNPICIVKCLRTTGKDAFPCGEQCVLENYPKGLKQIEQCLETTCGPKAYDEAKTCIEGNCLKESESGSCSQGFMDQKSVDGNTLQCLEQCAESSGKEELPCLMDCMVAGEGDFKKIAQCAASKCGEPLAEDFMKCGAGCLAVSKPQVESTPNPICIYKCIKTTGKDAFPCGEQCVLENYPKGLKQIEQCLETSCGPAAYKEAKTCIEGNCLKGSEAGSCSQGGYKTKGNTLQCLEQCAETSGKEELPCLMECVAAGGEDYKKIAQCAASKCGPALAEEFMQCGEGCLAVSKPQVETRPNPVCIYKCLKTTGKDAFPCGESCVLENYPKGLKQIEQCLETSCGPAAYKEAKTCIEGNCLSEEESTSCSSTDKAFPSPKCVEQCVEGSVKDGVPCAKACAEAGKGDFKKILQCLAKDCGKKALADAEECVMSKCVTASDSVDQLGQPVDPRCVVSCAGSTVKDYVVPCAKECEKEHPVEQGHVKEFAQCFGQDCAKSAVLDLAACVEKNCAQGEDENLKVVNV